MWGLFLNFSSLSSNSIIRRPPYWVNHYGFMRIIENIRWSNKDIFFTNTSTFRYAFSFESFYEFLYILYDDSFNIWYKVGNYSIWICMVTAFPISYLDIICTTESRCYEFFCVIANFPHRFYRPLFLGSCKFIQRHTIFEAIIWYVIHAIFLTHLSYCIRASRSWVFRYNIDILSKLSTISIRHNSDRFRVSLEIMLSQYI